MNEVSLYMTGVPARTVVPVEARTGPVLSDGSKNQLKTAVHQELIKRVDLEKLTLLQTDPGGRQKLLSTIAQLIGEQSVPLSAYERDLLADEVMDEVFGLGPLEPLLHDGTVSDILVNTHDKVYVERHGVIEKTNVVFRDNGHLMHIIDKIVSAVGRRIDESSPMVDARLLDGSRVNIVIPPLAVDGPIMSIRRFGSAPLTSDDLLRHRAFTPQMLELLKGAVRARLNIVVSGGTGAGKTTLLNVLSGFISAAERIVTIEDSAELQIKQEHVVRLECRPPNVEGKGAVRQRELVINALRMRPDRIILGEIRGEEALDVLQAMNTGHDGSITTVHANNPRDAIARLETMAMMGTVALPEKAIRAQIASAVHLIIQVSRMSDGSRRITHISEVTGSTGDIVSMQDIFLFEKLGLGAGQKVKGRFFATGIVPKFAEKLTAAGIPFYPETLSHSMEV
ncbi:CpaF family protein [Granulicella sibirica]|uniref:Type II/IV secretion system ATP hydrolase TadA/VirB11/CpaF, TadA subfamily n=1 Tax=Granulicella sibirica TaxID=2479048 RepID=A0A4Q0SYR0_9BACT|nr:CpaF family protein [Granulicella sibirica]RXH54341.1 Type II/IV secretion system ATP hydrolase TadA/VirB11/CpaF, TadA subfamily [Granulicella sibirica]